MFPYLIKKNNGDWPQMSGDNSFLGGSLLGRRWFLRMLDVRSVFHVRRRLIRSLPSKCEHWELVILDNTDKSRTFFHWKARAILRLWVLNKRRCYFWHMLADWLQRPDYMSLSWLYHLSISSAPVLNCTPIGLVRYFDDALTLLGALVFKPKHTEPTLRRRS